MTEESHKNALRILIIHRRVYPEVTGGLHIYLYEVARRLAQRGHDVHLLFATLSPSSSSYEFKDNFHWHRFYVKPSHPVSENMSYIQHTFERALDLHREKKFDLVNIHDSRTPLKLYSSQEFKEVPFLYTFQADTAYEYIWDAKKNLELRPSLSGFLKYHTTDRLRFAWHHRCTRKALERSKTILVLSDYVRGQIERNYGKKYLARITKIPPGINTDRFQVSGSKAMIRRELGLPEDKTIFLTVRRLVPRMGLLNLIEAAGIVCERKASIKNDLLFLLSGRGPLRETLEARIAELGLHGVVRLAGYVSDEDLPRYYQASDCFILPTEELEGFGLVTLEALSSGLPVLATPSGASDETVGAFFPGLLCSSHTPESIAEKILAFLSNQILIPSPKELRRIVEEHYHWDLVIPKIEQFFLLTASSSLQQEYPSY